MKSTTLKSTHTDEVYCRVCLVDLRLMTEPLWEEAECEHVDVCEKWHSGTSSAKPNTVMSAAFSLIHSVCTGEQFPFNKLLKLLGQICGYLSLGDLKLLNVNEKTQLGLIYLFFLKASSWEIASTFRYH